VRVAERSRRRALVVDEALQRRIIFGVAMMPTLGLVACAFLVAMFCRDLLGEAAMHEVELPSLVPLFLALLGFMLGAGAVFVFQALRFSHRIAGPAYRLVQSIRRIQGGDISFRVHLRRGDHLTDVAAEFNRLLDWLNTNPPSGVKRGSDLVLMAEDDIADERGPEQLVAGSERAVR
jgi:hypothetical protein